MVRKKVPEAPPKSERVHISESQQREGQIRGREGVNPEADRRLRESEERFRLLVEQAVDGIFVADAGGHYIEVNAAGCEMLGYSREEILARSIADVVAPEERQRIVPEVARFAGGGVVRSEWRLVRKDGSTFVGEVVGRQLADGRLQGVLRDISERKRAEKALQQAKELLSGLIDNTPDLIAAVNRDYEYIAFNEAYRKECREVFGVDFRLGASLAELLAGFPEDQQSARRLFGRALQGETVAVTEEFGRPGRARRCYELRFSPIRDAEGRVTGAAQIGRDISTRKRAEEALRGSEERYQLATEGAGVGLWDWDTRTGRVYYSPRWKALFGYEAHEIGESLEDWVRLLHPEEKEWICKFQEDFLAGTAKTVTIEYRLRHKDGSYRWIEASAVVVRDETGRACRLVGSHGDITARKRAEEAAQRARDRSELLSRTISRLLAAPDPQTVVEDLCNEVREFLKCDVFFNFLLEREAGRLRFNACGGVDPRLARKVEALELGESLCGTAARDGCRVHAENLGAADDRRSALVRSLGIRAYACHPLLGADNEVMGTLSFGARDRDRFSAEDLELMKAVTDHVAVALLRRRSEEARREAEDWLRTVLKATGVGLWLHELSTGRLIWDAQTRELFFVEPEEELTLDLFWSRVHPADRERMRRQAETALREGRLYVADHRTVDPATGRVRWIHAEGKGAGAAAGRAVRFEGINYDITERKEAEAALRESEERFRTLLRASSEVVYRMSPDWGEMSQLAGGNLLSDTTGPVSGWLEAYVPAEERPRVRAAIDEAIRRKGVFELEHRVRRADGSVGWALSRAVPLLDEKGGIAEWFGAASDITARKQAEAVLARDKMELEQLVADRTIKLQELVGELEHFSYSITHDLKAPLRAMRGFAEIAAQVSDDGEVKPLLEKISTAAERMDALIRDALNYSRTVRQELPLEDVDIGALLRGILDSYPDFQPSKTIIRVQERLPLVLGNEAGLTQCFSNLLGNAVKFVRPGQVPEIRIWAEERAGWSRIWFEDKGIGIPSEMLPRVFDMFSRASKDFKGTGIGLALVRKVVQRMGGRVGVESEEGKGSRFWIELKSGQARPTGQQVAGASAEPGAGTVLYVEDEEGDAAFMEMAFAGKGLKSALRVVGDGRAAIEYLSGAGKYGDRQDYPLPGVVLLDLNLPVVPGFEVLQWMRNHPDFAQTPVVIFSSSTREDDRVRARELGANEFVAKPASGMRFGEVVEQLKERWLTLSAEGRAQNPEGS